MQIILYLPKMVVSDSAASRKSLVAMARPLASSIGTSTNDFLKDCTMVLPGGMTGADMAALGEVVSLGYGS